MNPAQFEREHVYNIRHAYGQEGKHISYTPYTCMKIIQDPPPGVNEHQGCPYRHWDVPTLKHRLPTNYELNGATINEIVEKTKQLHYQMACQIFFEGQHNVKNYGMEINHSNQYFNESCKLSTRATSNQSGNACHVSISQIDITERISSGVFLANVDIERVVHLSVAVEEESPRSSVLDRVRCFPSARDVDEYSNWSNIQ
jgi:hypothetical protein